MTLKSLVVMATMLMLAGTAVAHGSHGESRPVSQQEVTIRADKAVQLLLDKNKLPPSWRSKRAPEVSTRDQGTDVLWVVRYQNPAEKDTAKQSLYIFIDSLGNYVAANHDGKL